MAAEAWIKQNDTSPSISHVLSYSDATKPNLTGATVRFKWKPAAAGGAMKQGICVITGNPAVDATVRYDWGSASDTAVAGAHLGEYEVTYANGRVETFPNEKPYIEFEITDDLDA